MTWPQPSHLTLVSEPTEASHTQVEVELLDGQLLFALLANEVKLSEADPLELIFNGQPLTLPISKIRKVARSRLMRYLKDAVGDACSLEHEQPVLFHLTYSDKTVLHGESLGYVNKKAGGLYLFVHQSDSLFKAIWIPRHAIKAMKVGASQQAQAFLPPPTIPVPAPAIPAQESSFKLATTMDELVSELLQVNTKPMISMVEALFELKLIDAVKLHVLQSEGNDALRSFLDAQVASGHINELQLAHAHSRIARLPEVNVEVFKVQPQAIEKISWISAARHGVVPLGMVSGALHLAYPAPMNRELNSRLSLVAGCPVNFVWADKSQIDRRLAKETHVQPQTNFGSSNASQPKGTFSSPNDLDLPSLMAAAEKEVLVKSPEELITSYDGHSSVVMLVTRMISDAYKQKASDIHIEANPGEQISRIRFRKDGDLEEYLQLPNELRPALVSRVKVMSRLDISEKRRPQDGKINFADFAPFKLELRVAILPTHDGLEDVVMRLLASSEPMALSKLGFAGTDEKIVKQLVHRPYGMILACGPTGSGKTTTLHSLLAEINTDSRKIWTAEDPIEITQQGLRQLQVNSKIGLTFASAMRAFLRADPDVIMIGEIRDDETARISIEASLTGHLVLSTLHTNNAAESVVRLLDLGMDPMNFGDSLIGIVAQRLVRGLCKVCKKQVPLSQADFDRLVNEYLMDTPLKPEEGRQRLLAAGLWDDSSDRKVIYQAVGCEKCNGKGYKGRIGIYEILVNNPELKHLIQTRAGTRKIFEQAILSGTRSLKHDAMEKVVRGMIDMDQARSIYS